jgi:hypothetical protein
VDRVLGRAEQQVRAGIRPSPAGQADDPGDVAVVPDAAHGGDAVSPAAACPRGRSQPDLGQRILHGSQPKLPGSR